MTTTAQSSTRGEYLLVQIELPDKQVQNFGILLLDPRSDQLYSRFRRDFDIWAGEDADWFESLGEEIFERSQELGGQKCLEWMESTLSHAVRVSTRVGVSLDSYQQMVQRLYVEHVLPEVLRFRSYLPLFSLEAFAGNLRERMQVEPEGWVEAWSQSRLSKDMFVTHTKGSEPAIPDDCVCAMRGHLIGSPDGKVLLVQQLVSDFRTEVIDGVFFVNSITPRNVPLLNTPSRIAPGLGDICCICQTGHYTECQQTPRSI
jgi:hypothetical protein